MDSRIGSARAYQGESDLYTGLIGILERMPEFVQTKQPRIPNPVDPIEDFANKWTEDGRLEKNFWRWHTQAKRDFGALSQVTSEDRLRRFLKSQFAIELSAEKAGEILDIRPSRSSVPEIVIPTVAISAPPRPWGENGFRRS